MDLTKGRIRRLRESSGLTLIELMATLGIMSVLVGIAMYSLKEMKNPLANAAFSVEQFLRLSRSEAISGTQVIQVSPLSSELLGASKSDDCFGTMTPLSAMTLELPTGISFADPALTVCFNARGLADASTSFQLNGPNGGTKSIKVALGGGTLIQ